MIFPDFRLSRNNVLLEVLRDKLMIHVGFDFGACLATFLSPFCACHAGFEGIVLNFCVDYGVIVYSSGDCTIFPAVLELVRNLDIPP